MRQILLKKKTTFFKKNPSIKFLVWLGDEGSLQLVIVYRNYLHWQIDLYLEMHNGGGVLVT